MIETGWKPSAEGEKTGLPGAPGPARSQMPRPVRLPEPRKILNASALFKLVTAPQAPFQNVGFRSQAGRILFAALYSLGLANNGHLAVGRITVIGWGHRGRRKDSGGWEPGGWGSTRGLDPADQEPREPPQAVTRGEALGGRSS